MLIHDAYITGSFIYNGTDISDITGSEASVAALNQFTSSYNTGSFTGSFTGNGIGLNGVISASFASNARSSSFASNAATSTSSSFAITSLTSSFANNFTVAGQIVAQTLNVQQVTSSVVFSSGSNVFGNSLANTQVMTGSVSITGSLSVNGTSAVNGTGTTNYLPKFTGASTIGNSIVFDDGTNVGIGTNAPTSKLTVLGDAIRYAPVSLASGNAVLVIKDDGSNGTLDIASEILGDANAASNPITFRVSNVSAGRFEAMRITNTGNLGLGVTPSAGGLSGYVLFELANGGASIYSGANQNLNGTNISWSGGTASYKISNFATLYNQQSGQHQWFSAPSGTAGNAITFTQAMTLGANGNLLVGTTTDNGARLQVSGSATFTKSGQVALITQSAASLSNGVYALDVDNSAQGSNMTTAGAFRINTGGNTAAFVVNGLGNVGIGTTSPKAKAEFASGLPTSIPTHTDRTNGIVVTDGGAIYGRIGVANFSGAGAGYPTYIQAGDFDGALYYNLLLNPLGGNVGIGTTSPSYKLDIHNGSDFDIRLKDTSLGGTVGILLEANNDFSGTSQAFIKAILGGGNGQSTLTFGTATNVGDTTASEKMRILPNGNVGIGTTSPTDKVSITAGALTVGFGNNDRSTLQGGSGFGSLLRLYNGSGTETVRMDAGGGGGTSWITSGNVGLGTTEPQSLLSLGSGVNAQKLLLYDANNNFKYGFGIQNNELRQFYPSDGFITFGTISTSNGTTFIERMRITSGGNLLVGTTTDNSARLQVAGSVTTGQIESYITNGGIISRDAGGNSANNAVEINIRPNAGKSGYLTFTENAVADRWSIGIQNGNSDLRFIPNFVTSSPVLTLSSTGAATFSEAVTINMSAGNYPRFITTVGAKSWEMGYRSGTTNYEIREDGTTRLAIANGGAATFSSLAGSGSRTVTADASGTLSASSDSSLKQEDKEYKIQGLSEILQLQPRAYKWLNDIEIRGEEATTEIGFFADEVNLIIPSAAPKGNDGLYGFYDRAVIAALVKAIQEQQVQINELKAIIAIK